MTAPGGGARLLEPVARLVTRRPRTVAALWLLALGVLALLGMGLEQKVSTKTVYVAGSAAERAHQIATEEFGREETLVLMLRGPRADLDRQGQALVSRLSHLSHTLVLSPWSSRGTIQGLRPRPGVAALLVSVGEGDSGSSSRTVPEVERIVDATVGGPVRVSVAGGPAVVTSLRDAIARASSMGERLALPILLLVLLFVCRSPLAAALPVVIGGLVASATRGILDLFSGAVSIDSIALGTAGMIGLALGVDYSLLIVSRFREEMDRHGDLERAVRTTVLRTGRTILPAGCGLVLAMLAALELIPGSFVGSVAVAAIGATVLSVISALLMTPAALTLLGSRLNRFALPRRRESGSLVMGWSRRLSGRPAVVLGLVFVLLLCSAWAFTLKTNVGVATLLPPNDPGRRAQEAIAAQLGPGWVAPFEVVVAGGDRPVTTPKRLHALVAFQRRVEADPGVAAMAGFASLAKATRTLGSAEAELASQERGAARLGRGLDRVQHGVVASAGGMSRGAAGAAALDSAVGQTHGGSRALSRGLHESAGGSTRLSGGLDRASEGSGKLTAATTKASSGAERLAANASRASKESGESLSSSRPLKSALRSGERSLHEAPLAGAEAHLKDALQALRGMTSGRADPQYAIALNAVEEAERTLAGGGGEGTSSDGTVAADVQEALGELSLALYLVKRGDKSQHQAHEGMVELADGAAKLDRGVQRLLAHSRRLSAAVARLSSSGADLPPGLRRLAAGTDQLLQGLGEAEGGAGLLAANLQRGASGSQRLAGAVGRLRAGSAKGSGANRLDSGSPGLFRSGYFYLAGLDGSPPERRDKASFLVNLSRGGSAGRMLVIPKAAQASAGAAATGDRLSADAEALARETGTEVVVGGLSPSLVDLNTALRDQTPLARLVLSLVTILVLLLVTRSLALPLLGALFNLVTVSATFGLLALLFNGSLLGGPGFVDASVIPATIVLTFGLAIDYEVFILARVREEYVRGGSTREAIDSGLGKTAPVISGAAVIMIAVFLAFAASPLGVLRDLGVALALGVMIDAFIVRFVLLPAAMRALGDRCWWVPRWLQPVVPGSRLRKADARA